MEPLKAPKAYAVKDSGTIVLDNLTEQGFTKIPKSPQGEWSFVTGLQYNHKC